MKKSLFLTVALLVSGGVFASTDHYVLRDGNHVQHLKITTVNNEITVSSDVDFCELKVHLSPTGAKVEQSEDCRNFAAGICRFSSDGKELIKVK